MKPLLLFFIFFLFLLSNPALADLVPTPNDQHYSYTIKHGESQFFQIKLTNTNLICTISCTYSLIDINAQTNLERESFVLPPGGLGSLGYTFYRYTFTTQDYILQPKIYNLIFNCQDQACINPQSYSLSFSIDVEPALNDQEISAQNFININLKSNLNKFNDIEVTLQKLRSKVNDLPQNVKIQEQRNLLNNYERELNYISINIGDVSSKFSNGHIVESMNIFDVARFSNLINNQQNLIILQKQIDEIVDRHNKIIVRLNEVNSLLSSKQELSKILNMDQQFFSLQSQFTQLNTKFSNGNFNDYDEIDFLIDQLSPSINSFSNDINSRLAIIINQGVSLVQTESSTICNLKSICGIPTPITSMDLNGIQNVCNSFKSISTKIDEVYSLDNNKYIEYVKQIEGLNKQISLENKEIESKNLIISEENNNISKLNSRIHDSNNIKSNLNNISITSIVFKKEIDTSSCSGEPINTSESIEANINKCTSLMDVLFQLKNIKEKSFFFKIKKFYFSFVGFESINITKTPDIPSIELVKYKNKKFIDIPQPKKLEFSTSSKDFIFKYCFFQPGETRSPDIINQVISSEGKSHSQYQPELKEQTTECCFLNKCQPCCIGDECKNDEKSYPVIFLHGHSIQQLDQLSSSLSSFDSIQNGLVSKGYISRGILRPNDDIPNGLWGKGSQPSTIKVTYYENVYDQNGQIIAEPSKDVPIPEYAKRLKKLIDNIKLATGRNKVNIIAHSMGGLVARSYIQQFSNDDSINKLIMIATPNHGIYGEGFSAYTFCNSGSPTGNWKECESMKYDNPFITQLNNGDETPGNIKYYTIAGKGCFPNENKLGIEADGDGVVRTSSPPLNGATNYEINFNSKVSTCTTFQRSMHTDLLNPDKYPQVLEYITTILKE